MAVPSPALLAGEDAPTRRPPRGGWLACATSGLAADDGATVEVRSGLSQGERVILNPPIGLTDMRMAAHPAPRTVWRALPPQRDGRLTTPGASCNELSEASPPWRVRGDCRDRVAFGERRDPLRFGGPASSAGSRTIAIVKAPRVVLKRRPKEER